MSLSHLQHKLSLKGQQPPCDSQGSAVTNTQTLSSEPYPLRSHASKGDTETSSSKLYRMDISFQGWWDVCQ